VPLACTAEVARDVPFWFDSSGRMSGVTRTVDDIEQALADLLANYSVEKGNGWNPCPT